MTKYEYISRNIVFIKEGIMYGIISTCTLNHFRIYAQFENYLVMGYSIKKAVLCISKDNRICESMFFKIKKEMESEI
jgi:hypothetical protein